MKQQKQKNNSKTGEEKSSPSNLEKKLQRKCIACGKILERDLLIRIMSSKQTNEIVINPDNKTFGRSAYLCKNEKCINDALKKNRIERALRSKIDQSLSEKLKMMLN